MPTVNRNIIVSGTDAARVAELHAQAILMGLQCITPIVTQPAGGGASFALLTDGFEEGSAERDAEEERRCDFLYEVPKKAGAQALEVFWGRDTGWDGEVEPEHVDAMFWKGAGAS